nr:hypothetical protein [Butyrivibrio sp.]
MKKKVISMLMASAMTLSLLAGCGSSSAPATTTDSGSTDTAQATTETATATTDTAATDTAAADTAASGDAVTINLYRCSFNVANPDSAQVQKVQDAINAYIKDKINVQINLTDIGSGEYT